MDYEPSAEVREFFRSGFDSLSVEATSELNDFIQDAVKFRALKTANPVLFEEFLEDIGNSKTSKNSTDINMTESETPARGNSDDPATPKARKSAKRKRLLQAMDSASQETGDLGNPPPPAKTVTRSKIPAMFINGNIEFTSLQSLLSEIKSEDYSIVAKKYDDVESYKVQVSTTDVFRRVKNLLITAQVHFHTNQLEEDKPLKFVVKGIPVAIEETFVRDQLEQRNIKPLKITRLYNQKRQPLQLYLVEIPRTVDIANLLQINRMGQLKVTLEKLRKGKWATQCHRCQRFNHAAVTCFNVPRCVKCAGTHITSECDKKSWGKEVKCANCGGSHPASYKGCPSFPKPKLSYADALKKGPFQGQGKKQKGPFKGQGKNQKGPFQGQGKNQKGPFQGQDKNQKGPFQGQVANTEAANTEVQMSASASQTEGQFLQELHERQDLFFQELQEKQEMFQEKQEQTNQLLFSTLGDVTKLMGELSAKFSQYCDENQDRPPSRQRNTPRSQRHR